MTGKCKPMVLCILDGWGCRKETDHNAIALANTPHHDFLLAHSAYTELDASAHYVGLPQGQMGNSEVGHMTIGSGRVIFQDLPRIDEAVRDNKLAENSVFQNLIKSLKMSGKPCHLLGLLSPGGVHSHQEHILALARLLDKEGIPTHIHAFLDGRDTPPASAHQYLSEFLLHIHDLPMVRLATVGGRFFAMDRDQRWDRIAIAYEAIVEGRGIRVDSPLDHIMTCYEQGVTDEFITPFVNAGYEGMKNGEGLLMANFRADRVRQILRSLLLPDFTGFSRNRLVVFGVQAGMTEYSDDLTSVLPALFPAIKTGNVLGEVISAHGLTQLRLAETEKYAHVTFFFNGGREQPFEGEDRHLIPSPRVATYDLQPEMSAAEVTDFLVTAISEGKYDLVVVNYANPDMVGHTGNMKAAIRAVEAIDDCLGRIISALDQYGGTLVLTADHGNIELMEDPVTHDIHTAHTLNRVPLIVYGQIPDGMELISGGGLSDIAPTVLTLMGLDIPGEMTGTNLLEQKKVVSE